MSTRMPFPTSTVRKTFSGTLALAVVVGANVLAAEADHGVPEAPPAISALAAPDLGALPALDDIEFVVPVLRRPEMQLPALPQTHAESWAGRGVMAAPVQRIEIAAPSIAVDLGIAGPELESVELQRPALPAPPPVR